MNPVQEAVRPAVETVPVPSKISLRGVSKSFNARGKVIQALSPVDLDIAHQEFVSLVGPSGCGKSTVLNMIAGLLTPTTGTVLYDGAAVTRTNSLVGYMTQKDTLLPWRSVADNIGVALELRCRAVPARERRDRIAEIMELVGLTGFEKHYPNELSGGMRKRAALARTLIYEPETLLMDEPFGALDAQLKLVMHDELLRITRLRRIQVVFVTHDLGEAIALSDRVLVFSGRPGRVKLARAIGIPKPRDPFRVRFTKQFGDLHEALWDELKDEVALGTEA